MHHSQRCLLILDSQPVVINRRVDNNHRNKVKAEGPGNGCRNLRAGTISTSQYNQYKPIQISTSQYESVQANTNQHKHGVSAPTPAGLSRPATRCLTRIFYPPVDFVPGLFIKHSAIPKNTPSFPRRRESTIPAHAGIQRPTTPTPEKNTPSFPKTLRHSREGGNPQFPRMREFNVPLPQRPRKTLHHSQKHSAIPKNTPSFPRRRESTIPAHAGIQRPTTPMPEKNTPSFPKTLRHSREGGNPQFPRMREFNVPLPQRPRKTLRHSQKHSVIPAKAGIHNFRACGNSTSHYPNAREKHSAIPATVTVHPGS